MFHTIIAICPSEAFVNRTGIQFPQADGLVKDVNQTSVVKKNGHETCGDACLNSFVLSIREVSYVNIAILPLL